MLSPVYSVIAVPLGNIRANSYNPNSVAPPEMKLLETSILEDGYTMPTVCYRIPNSGTFDTCMDLVEGRYVTRHCGTGLFEIVDGYHRYTTMVRNAEIRERERGMLPCSVIDKSETDRMASTIRHNRARGEHSIELMSNIVAELTTAGMSDAWIIKHIGMDKDELLRLKQITGLASLFADKTFNQSWSATADHDELIEEESEEDAA